MTKRRIFLQLRTAFGKDRIYPVCAYSLDLTALTGRPTLLPQDLAVIQRLGFEVCWIPATESDPLQCLAEMEKV